MINAPVSSSTTKRQGEREREREESRQDVKQQYPFEGFNIADECPTELMSSFSQWINEGFTSTMLRKETRMIST